jgi:hypothetical protein
LHGRNLDWREAEYRNGQVILGYCPSLGRTFIVWGHVRITSIAYHPSAPHSRTDSNTLPLASPKVPIDVADDYLNALVQDGADRYDSYCEEDEFFDPIESNNLPDMVVHDGLASPSTSTITCMPIPTHIKVEPCAGYANMWTKLKLSEERPEYEFVVG